jgi:thiol:disulfide interchange protein DsbD
MLPYMSGTRAQLHDPLHTMYMKMAKWFAACLLALLVRDALALESAPVVSTRSVVTLVSAQSAVAAGQPVDLALRVRLSPGWHVYWQNPGDAGQAPQVELYAPVGSTVTDIRWPAPRRHVDGTITTFIHEGEVLLPFSLTLPAGIDAAIPVVARANWLVCRDICIPEEGMFRLTLPAGDVRPSEQAALFDLAQDAGPQKSTWTATLDTQARLLLTGDGASEVREAFFVPALRGVLDSGAEQAFERRDRAFELRLRPGPDFDPARRLEGVLLLSDGQGVERALWIETPGEAIQRPSSVRWVSARLPEIPEATLPASGAWSGFVYAVLFAFAGGMLLNLMPCVFPVLAIKALSFARMSGHERHAVRSQSLAYCAGVMATFVLLAAALLALRSLGMQSGWGFQFQSPVFVIAMSALLFLIGLNLSGVFELGTGLASSGDALASKGGIAGSFFTGALAVVVATPCTAPFMGGAIAVALAAPAPQTLAVFLAMGGGLALPYALLAFFPGIARRMPRPGPWMDRLKQGLAFPMYAAAAWLVWVLSRQSGADGVLAALCVLLLLSVAAWMLGAAQRGAAPGCVWRGGALVLLLMAASIVGYAPYTSGGGVAGSSLPGEPSVYSLARLADLRAKGQPVFVNMTAAWCVTCLMNERIALSTPEVRQAFAQRGITYLKGDWTRSDPDITSFLHEHGRDGVPLYVFYPAGGASPVVLPQILTAGIVLDATVQVR